MPNKDTKINIRVSSYDKFQIRKKALAKGFGTISAYILFLVNNDKQRKKRNHG